MKLIVHNLKVAFRNLMKYKLQTVISVLSIAIGIIIISVTHSLISNARLPNLYEKPYGERAYIVDFENSEGRHEFISADLVRAIKKNGGPESAEMIAIPPGGDLNREVVFHLPDSTWLKGSVAGAPIDSEYMRYIGFRSAITGKEIKGLKPGEAIISDVLAKKYFRGKNPIGTVQVMTGPLQPVPVTIVDVYDALESTGTNVRDDKFFFSLSENYEDELDFTYFTLGIRIVLKEGCTEEKLLEELNRRIEPFGMEARLWKEIRGDEKNFFYTVKLVIYLISSLILLTAIIGFLRMQTQLFQIRRREIALRIVNGAGRWKLFVLLMTEIALVIITSMILAIWLGSMLQEYLEIKIDIIFERSSIAIHDLWPNSLAIGGGLFLICGLIAWLTILNVCKSQEGIYGSLRRSRNHLIRNIMLTLQISISMIFVCCTFIIVKCGDKILSVYNIPVNKDFYKDCIYFHRENSGDPDRLLEAFRQLPELDKMVICSFNRYNMINNITFNQELAEKLNDYHTLFRFYYIPEPAVLSLFGIDVEWFPNDVNREECILLDESLYEKLREIGALDSNTLTINVPSGGNANVRLNDCYPLTIAGIVRNLPYCTGNEGAIVISPILVKSMDYVLVPRPGKGKALAKSVNETIERLEPENFNKLTDDLPVVMPSSSAPLMVELINRLGWILGGISLIICAMSILSTISLDTRYRRKEVAVRKVNGAKGKDIYKMFGKIYLLLMFVSMIISIPVILLFNRFVSIILQDYFPESGLSPVGPIIMGILIVVVLILSIVGWQVNRAMQTDPSEIIAKE